MRKKLIALACIAIASIVIIYYYVLSPSPTETTILEIVSNPEAWVDKRVKIDGMMTGPLISIPEVKPPYNYWLQDKDNRTITIGVKYPGEMLDQYVTVTRTVQAGYAEGLMGRDLIYYIEAERIESTESYQEIEGHSYTCFGGLDRLITPCSKAVDGDWLTKVE